MNTNLIECADCGKEISRRAEKCIHCGAPNLATMNFYEEEKHERRENDIKWAWSSLKFTAPVTIILWGGLWILIHVIGIDTQNAILGTIPDGILGLIAYASFIVTFLAIGTLVSSYLKKIFDR